jgi:hypothetical protein
VGNRLAEPQHRAIDLHAQPLVLALLPMHVRKLQRNGVGRRELLAFNEMDVLLRF